MHEAKTERGNALPNRKGKLDPKGRYWSPLYAGYLQSFRQLNTSKHGHSSKVS